MNNYKMDSHKLIYHPCEVAYWLRGENVYPIEIEISPSGTCNHRCIFCAVDYLGYQPSFLDKDVILREIKAMSEKGLKSVICSGEGEPLLNKDMPELANAIKDCHVDVAMSSNGVLFNPEKIRDCLGAFTWIRFSVAAIREPLYQKIHRGKAGDLDKALSNIAYAVEYKKEKKLQTTLGVQCLMIPENVCQIVDMAKELKKIGIDYFTVKPYSQHTQSENKLLFDYEAMLDMQEELESLKTDEYNIVFRANAMKKIHKEKPYDKCYGLPFMTHIDSKGNVWPCINFVGEQELSYGNIYEETFADIWEGTHRQEVVKKIENSDINEICREACRLDEINKYLYELKHPSGHVNFI